MGCLSSAFILRRSSQFNFRKDHMTEMVVTGCSCQGGMEEHCKCEAEIAMPLLVPSLFNVKHQRKTFYVLNNFMKYKIY